MSDRKVTLARPWTDAAGKEHKPDATVTVDAGVAETLLWKGYARPADTKGEKA